jgi:hypothetical protein
MKSKKKIEKGVTSCQQVVLATVLRNLESKVPHRFESRSRWKCTLERYQVRGPTVR